MKLSPEEVEKINDRTKTMYCSRGTECKICIYQKECEIEKDLCDTIESLQAENEQLKAKIEKAYEVANNSIYFNDNSDYLPDLYSVCRRLKPEIQDGIGEKCLGLESEDK